MKPNDTNAEDHEAPGVSSRVGLVGTCEGRWTLVLPTTRADDDLWQTLEVVINDTCPFVLCYLHTFPHPVVRTDSAVFVLVVD